MLKVARPQLTPPSGWRFIDPDTRFPFKAFCKEELLSKVVAHRNANKLLIPDDLAERIEDWMCRDMPDGICVDSESGAPMRGVTRVAETLVNATLGVFKKSRIVKEKEANSRAGVCAGCSHNVLVPGCGSCRGVNHIIQGMIGSRWTAVDSKLNSCERCGMLLRVLVHCGTAAIKGSVDARISKPENCWLPV